jgi:hypothetical protein
MWRIMRSCNGHCLHFFAWLAGMENVWQKIEHGIQNPSHACPHLGRGPNQGKWPCGIFCLSICRSPYGGGKARAVWRKSFVKGTKAACISSLHLLAKECSSPDWDGYGAEPSNRTALAKAQEFVNSLPGESPLPECSVEREGWISLDRNLTPHRTLSFTVGESDHAPYAWLDGRDRGHGVVYLRSRSVLQVILSRFFGDAFLKQ